MNKKRNYKVYVHIAPNGKRYYGITKQRVEKRWQNGYGYKNNEHFWNSICKYGWNEGFEHIIIAKGLTEEEAKWLEIELIREHDTTNPKYGYNISLGGEGGNGANKKSVYIIEFDKEFDSVSDCAEYLKCRQQVVSNAINSKSKFCKGYHVIWSKDRDNKELIDKVMSYKEKNSPIYVIELDKIFDNAKDCAEFLGCDSGSVNNVLNENRKYKMIKGCHIIYVKDKDNKELIEEIMQYESNKKSVYIIELDKEFDSVSDCAEYLKCDKNNISGVLNGKRKTAKGYHVIWAKDRDKLTP